jgi:predicted nucleic acid-binding protein
MAGDGNRSALDGIAKRALSEVDLTDPMSPRIAREARMKDAEQMIDSKRTKFGKNATTDLLGEGTINLLTTCCGRVSTNRSMYLSAAFTSPFEASTEELGHLCFGLKQRWAHTN